MPKTITFKVDERGRYTADDFPEEIEVSEQVLTHTDQKVLHRRNDRLYVSVQNGEAEYLITGERAAPKAVFAGRMYLRR